MLKMGCSLIGRSKCVYVHTKGGCCLYVTCSLWRGRLEVLHLLPYQEFLTLGREFHLILGQDCFSAQ